jgi:hypothetical protein
MTVMHVPKRPRHPEAPTNEEEAGRNPNQKHHEERLHGQAPFIPTACKTPDQALLSMRQSQSWPAFVDLFPRAITTVQAREKAIHFCNEKWKNYPSKLCYVGLVNGFTLGE